MTDELTLTYEQRQLLETLDPISAVITFCMWNDIFVNIEAGGFRGKCVGGPLDGNGLKHHSSLCPVILMGEMHLVIQQPTSAMLETSPGYYRHKDDAWHWTPAKLLDTG